MKYFYGKKIPYAITPNFKNIEKTYCSELVWYSYYKAGKTFVPINTTALLIAPYDFINSWAVSYNDFKFIDNKW